MRLELRLEIVEPRAGQRTLETHRLPLAFGERAANDERLADGDDRDVATMSKSAYEEIRLHIGLIRAAGFRMGSSQRASAASTQAAANRSGRWSAISVQRFADSRRARRCHAAMTR